MWKERLQQLGQRRNHDKQGKHQDKGSRLRSNTAAAALSADNIASARDGPRNPEDNLNPVARTPTMDSRPHHSVPPSKAGLKTWWNHFIFTQRAKKEAEEKKGQCTILDLAERSLFLTLQDGIGQNVVFGKPLKESLKYANVQISTANSNGDLYVWGYIPVVVAKWCVMFPLVHILLRLILVYSGLHLKETGMHRCL